MVQIPTGRPSLHKKYATTVGERRGTKWGNRIAPSGTQARGAMDTENAIPLLHKKQVRQFEMMPTEAELQRMNLAYAEKFDRGPTSDEMTDALTRLRDLARLTGGADADRLVADRGIPARAWGGMMTTPPL